MKRIKVLLVIDTLEGGGAERMVVTIAHYLDRSRFDLQVCCLAQGGVYLESVAGEGAPVHILGKRGPIDVIMIIRLIRLMRRGRFQIMHSFMFTSNLWGRIGAILAGIPIRIAAERNVDDWKGPIRRWLDRRLASWTSRVVAVSGKVEVFCHEQIGIPTEKLITIRNGISVDLFKPLSNSREFARAALGLAAEDLVVTQVARLVPQKGYEVLLEAAVLVYRRHPRMRLMIVGDGPSGEALAAQAEQLGIGKSVTFLGFKKDVREVLWATDLFALASWREGLPVALLEAMAASLPSVVTLVGGNNEVVIEGETGFLVPPGDAVQMADRINLLLDDPSLRERLGTAARLRVESEFSAKRMVHETETLYERCLRKA